MSWFSSAPSTKTPTYRMSRVLSTTSPSLYGWRYEEFLYRAILVMKFPSWVGRVRLMTLEKKGKRNDYPSGQPLCRTCWCIFVFCCLTWAWVWGQSPVRSSGPAHRRRKTPRWWSCLWWWCSQCCSHFLSTQCFYTWCVCRWTVREIKRRWLIISNFYIKGTNYPSCCFWFHPYKKM